jgi:hypothetical protein
MPLSISWAVICRQPFIDQKKIIGPSGDDICLVLWAIPTAAGSPALPDCGGVLDQVGGSN